MSLPYCQATPMSASCHLTTLAFLSMLAADLDGAGTSWAAGSEACKPYMHCKQHCLTVSSAT
jgi:hypothetical protein